MFGLPRRPLRKLASLKVQFRAGEEWSEVTLANVSARGVMVRSPAPPQVGADIEIRHRGVTITGQVVWARRTRFGVRSFEEVDLSALLAQSDLQPDRRHLERAPPTNRRVRARWMFWNS
jgi:hypothetical protein